MAWKPLKVISWGSHWDHLIFSISQLSLTVVVGCLVANKSSFCMFCPFLFAGMRMDWSLLLHLGWKWESTGQFKSGKQWTSFVCRTIPVSRSYSWSSRGLRHLPEWAHFLLFSSPGRWCWHEASPWRPALYISQEVAQPPLLSPHILVCSSLALKQGAFGWVKQLVSVLARVRELMPGEPSWAMRREIRLYTGLIYTLTPMGLLTPS